MWAPGPTPAPAAACPMAAPRTAPSDQAAWKLVTIDAPNGAGPQAVGVLCDVDDGVRPAHDQQAAGQDDP